MRASVGPDTRHDLRDGLRLGREEGHHQDQLEHILSPRMEILSASMIAQHRGRANARGQGAEMMPIIDLGQKTYLIWDLRPRWLGGEPGHAAQLGLVDDDEVLVLFFDDVALLEVLEEADGGLDREAGHFGEVTPFDAGDDGAGL